MNSSRDCVSPRSDPSLKPVPILEERAFERATAYVASHLGERLSLSKIAEAACISRFHFARLFRARTGYSPMAWVMRLRLERAKEILAEGEICIAATAAELGFFDQSHFTRSFRRATGLPPRAFSRLARHANASRAASVPPAPPRAHASEEQSQWPRS